MKKMITIAVVSLSLISQTVLAESTVGDVEVYNKILQQRLIVNQAKSELDMALSKIKMHEENIESSKSGRKLSAVLVISSAVIMFCIPSTPSSQFPSIGEAIAGLVLANTFLAGSIIFYGWCRNYGIDYYR